MKKFFAVASVTAIAGVVMAGSAVGCSSSSTTTTGDEAGSSSGKEGGTSSGKEGGTSSSSGTSGSSGDTEGGTGEDCPAAFPGDDQFDYKTANVAATGANAKCDQTDLDFFNAEIKAGRSKFTELEASMKARKAACAQCIFTREGDTAWGPIVCTGTGECTSALQYYGACFARAPGGSDACGKSAQSTFDCIDAVCDSTKCGSDAATTACVQAVLKDKTSCGKFDINTACPTLQTLLKTCGADTGGQFTQVIQVMCGP